MSKFQLSLPKQSIWVGRNDGGELDRFFNNVTCANVSKVENKSFCIVGFECDEGIKRNLGRIGASRAPDEIRKKLASLPFHANAKIFDVGSICCIDNNLEKAQKDLEKIISRVCRKAVTVVIGGGHELMWGHYSGLFENYKDISIINIDAHFDIRPTEKEIGTSGTSFYQIAQNNKKRNIPFKCLTIGIQPEGNTPFLFNLSKELGVQYILAEKIHINDREFKKELKNYISNSKKIYVSICMDVFAQPFAPGVSAPSPLGLFPMQVIDVIKILGESKKVIGFDVAEVSPRFDCDGTTARLAAQLIATFVSNYRFL